MIEPAAVLLGRRFSDESLHMALAENPGRFRDSLGAIAVLVINDLRKPLEKESAVNKDGNSSDPHVWYPRNKTAPSFRHTLRIDERAY